MCEFFEKFVDISFPRFGNPEPGNCQLAPVSVSFSGLGHPIPGNSSDSAG